MKFLIRNSLGAFADGAVLFPLLALLSTQGGFSGATLLLSAGLAYLSAALVFRIPMSVQPLKSIAIASVAVGASFLEVRLSGALLGVLCLGLNFVNLDLFCEKMPKAIIHSLQVGLGAVLLIQGAKQGWHFAALGLLICIFVLPRHWSALGVIATLGLVWGILQGSNASRVMPSVSANLTRLDVVLGLVLPQLVLTLANSVVSTRDVAERYFRSQAERVTVGRLLRSIGFGNLVSATFGGLPYCHGSGGLTAHYRGGANHWLSNVIIGVALLVMAGVQSRSGHWGLGYPVPVLSALLIATGIFHMTLAKPTWDTEGGKIKIAMALLTGLLTQNMLFVLGVALVLEYGLLREKRTT